MNISLKKLSTNAVGLCLGVSAVLVNAADLPAPVENEDYYYDGAPSIELTVLGRNLFFDKIISGNKNIACATCHNPLYAGSDGLSLGVGEGGTGLGIQRDTGTGSDAVESRIGRHAPHLFNLGAKEFTKLNWNGIMQNIDGEIVVPTAGTVVPNLHDVLSAQSMFPIVNLNEMLGDARENELVDLIRPGKGRFEPLWGGILDRLKAIPEYVTMFIAAFDDVDSADDIAIQHYANAMGAFQTTAFRSDNSPFDQYLRGDADALTDKQIRGMELFYGEAGCSGCHSGKFFTDHEFHGIAMPQVGPGPEAKFPLQDRGRAEATNDPNDWAKFRTPSLRNVWITGPYGHDGAYKTLKSVVQHHLNPLVSLENYNAKNLILPSDEILDSTDMDGYNDLTLRQTIIDANELEPMTLTSTQLGELLEFLRALTDWNALNQTWMVPKTVPSGLPVRD